MPSICVFSLCLLIGNFMAAGRAQTALPVANDAAQVPLCNPESIDASFTFASAPPGHQTVSLHFENTGDVACRLEGEVSPSFSVDGHSMFVKDCWMRCSASDPQTGQGAGEIVLAHGELTTVDLQWASTGQPCQWADWAALFVHWAKQKDYLFTPSEWPMHLCSAVVSSGYRASVDSPFTGTTKSNSLRVSVSPSTIYSDERAILHVELTDQPDLENTPTGCADLYTVRRDVTAPARLDPLPVVGTSQVASYTADQIREDQERSWPSWKKDRLRKCPIAAEATEADANISASDLANVTHLEWRTTPVRKGGPVFLSVETHFTVLDVDTLEPNWGPTVYGIRAGLSLDRDHVRGDETVPIHVRWQNVNAALPLAQGECQGPWPEIEVQDTEHHVVLTVPLYPMCMGHGWGPFEIPKGKSQHAYWEVGTQNTATRPSTSALFVKLPGPGEYYLVSVWKPHVLDRSGVADPAPFHREGRVAGSYATARSTPVRVQVEP